MRATEVQRESNVVSSDPAHATDRELISSILAGAKDDYRHLVERYQDRVYGLLMRQVGSRELALELAQEAFVKAYLGLPRFRFQAGFSTWLTRIALNVSHNYFSSRRFREERRSESFDVDKHEMSNEEGKEEVERAAYVRARFRDALAQLKARSREVLVLCGLEERSYEDTAAILQIPVGTVRSRLNTARLELKELLGEEL